MKTAESNLRGISAMLAAVTFFAVNDTALKVLAERYPIGQIMAVRGILSVGLTAAIVVATGHGRRSPALFHPLVLLRAGTEIVITLLFLFSIPRLALADITAILQATPIFMTIFAAVFGLERIGWRRWSAVGVGFLGVLLVAKPGYSGFDPFMLAALGCAILVAARDLLARGLATRVPVAVITLATTIALTATGGALGFRETWLSITPRDFAIFAITATAMSMGNLCIILAFRSSAIAVVSPYRYAVLVTAVAAGYLVFGDWPDPVAWLGIALIAATGIYTMRRERLRERARMAALETPSKKDAA